MPTSPSSASSYSPSPSTRSVTSSPPPPPPPRILNTTGRPGTASGPRGRDTPRPVTGSIDAAYDPSAERIGRGRSSPWGRSCPVSSDVSRSSSAAAAAAAGGEGGGSGDRGILQRHSAIAARSPRPTASRLQLRTTRRGSTRRPQSATLAIAEAEAVRAARDFSMDMYRELHQRKFKSANEELDFLRKDFVASRRTLALLHEDNVRLERELLARVTELAEVHAKLEEALREQEQQQQRTRLNTGGERAEVAAAHQRRYGSSSLWAEGVLADDGRAKNTTSAALLLRPDGSHEAEEGGEVGQQSPGPQQQQRARSREGPFSEQSSSPVSAHATPRPSQVSARGSLALYAATASSVRGGRDNKRSNSMASSRQADGEQRELIRDLRANLARRDTSLNELQMELDALQNAKRANEADLQQEQLALAEAKKERDAMQARLTAQEAQHAATTAELSDLRAQHQLLLKEKDDLRRRLTTAELLYEHAGSPAVGGLGGPGAADKQHAQEDALREQLRLYRSKWQAAEDETELLHQRISQLQRQLVTGADSSSTHSGRGSRAGGGGGATLVRSSSGELAVPAAPGGDAVVQEAKHTASLAALRRQHQEQLLMHIEEAQRLQRRLDRALENATFHEDQLRQQRQEDARQHHEEVQALQTQLRTAQSELVRAQEDREHLARQLRRTTEQETTVEVLRGQVEQLKQRLGEVGAELAQVHGREKESSLQLQRERLERAKAGHSVEELQEALEREKTESQYMREEVKLMRERLGVQEAASTETSASAAPMPGRPSLPYSFSSSPFPGVPAGYDAAEAAQQQQQPPRPSTRVAAGGSGGGILHEDVLTSDAAALASEVKGYVGLMRVNAALQRRIGELEACVRACAASAETATDPAVAATAPASVPTPPPPQVKADSTTEVVRAAFAAQWASAEQERRQLLADNKTLADGVELLQRQLRRYREKRCRTISRTPVRYADNHDVEDASDDDSGEDVRKATAALKGSTGAPRGPSRPHSRSRSKPRESRVRHRLKSAQAHDYEAALRYAAAGTKKQKPARAAQHEVRGACIACKACQASSSKAEEPVVVAQSAAPAAVPKPVVAAPPSPQQQQQVCCRCHPPYSLEWIAQLSQSVAQEQAPAASPSSSSPVTYVRVRSQLAVRSPPQDAHVDAAAASPPALPSTSSREHRATVTTSAGPQHTERLSPRRHRVYGSMLPPVYYPPLVTRSRD